MYGYMPAKTTIFNFRGVAKHTFPLGPRNTILFSPYGRFVLVAGFGNLAGQMDIFNVEKDYAKITTVEASNASVCEWSPDESFILTATTSPRLRVDNGIRLWHVSGGLMYNEDMHELYDVFWRPQSSTQHPPGDPLKTLPTPHPSASAYLSTKKVPAKPVGAYRPPGARGQGTPLAFKREDEGGSGGSVPGQASTGPANGFGKSRRRAVPGAEPTEEYLPPGAAPGGGVALPGSEQEKLSKSAAKNKKKREARKGKEGEEPAPAAPKNHERSQSKGKNNTEGNNKSKNQQANGAPNGTGKAAPKPAAPAPAPAPAPAEQQAEDPGPQDKKIRGLLKKMRAIDELKMRLAGGEELEDTQMKKIHTEEGVRKELESLGYNG